MKKTLLGILVALCAVFMCIGFTACGDSVDGSYKTVSITVEGKDYNVGDTIPAGEVFKGSYEIRSDDLTVTINKKSGNIGTFVYSRSFGGGLDASSGQWRDTDGEITFSFTSSSYKMEYDGKDGLTVTQQLNTSEKGNIQVVYKLKKQ